MKSLIKKLIYESFNDKPYFEMDHLDSYKTQSYHRCRLKIGDTLLAYADFTTLSGDDDIEISFIESQVKGKGYGEMVMKHLASIYGYKNLNRTSLTPDGAKMRQKLDKHYNFDYEVHQQSKDKHIRLETINKIPNPIIRMFLITMVKEGYSEAWSKFLKSKGFMELNDELEATHGFDFNDISDISEWIKGSPTNNNDPYDEVPEIINTHLNQLLEIK